MKGQNTGFVNTIPYQVRDLIPFFPLIAERADTIPSTTQAILTWESGHEGWFRSDVKLTFDAQDNQGGLGVDYTLYRIGDNDWREYTTPLTFIDKGNYLIEFYSVDNDENIEETKTINFSIDKTLPEAEIIFNPATLRMEIKGVDDNGQTVIQRQTLNKTKFPDKVIIADQAGNSLAMDGYIREDKNPSEISIRSLSYNNNLSALLTENILFTVSTQDKNKVFKSLLQTFYWRDTILITLLYQQRTNTTTVVTKIPNQKPQKQVLPGLTALSLKTNDANLEYGSQ